MPKAIDLTGKTFGRWTVLRVDPVNSGMGSGRYWICRCECGRTKSVRSGVLVRGESTQCRFCGRGKAARGIPAKVSDSTIRELHGRGLNGHQMAAELGCTPSAIHYRCRMLELPLPGPRNGMTTISPGQTYGRLTVRERHCKDGKRVHWKCDCTCGRVAIVSSALLRSGKTKSCGCLRQEIASDHGQVIGKLKHKRRPRLPRS